MTNYFEKTEWFGEWFDSPYYHLLYGERDENEANAFLSELLRHLKLKTNSEILDVACGRGRHSRFLSNQGFRVTGIDLSSQSINFAKRWENPTLRFEQFDMRENYSTEKYDLLLSLFTSFGYFETVAEDLKVLQAFKKSLRKNGLLVLDYFNPNYVLNSLVPYEEKVINEIKFIISREVKAGFICKNITFSADNTKLHFQEKVRLINLVDFKSLFSKVGLKINKVFGDYELNAFNEDKSDRLILLGSC